MEPSKAQLARYVQFSQFGLVGAILAFGDALYVPLAIRENKWMSVMIIWLLGNAIGSNITNSNAFEIYLGETLIYSTLATGHLPTYPELVEALASHGVILNANR